MNTKLKLIAGLLLLAGSAFAQAASLTASGYSENFDSMGTSGTAAPSGWSVYNGNSGTSNSTWTAAIPAGGSNSVATMTLVNSALSTSSKPTSTKNNGYNAAISSGKTADRVLATSPTSIAGAALQLSLSNNTGASFSQLTVSYDTVRFTAVSSANELPGYWLFYSLDGQAWNNVAALNPTLASVPNTVGVSHVNKTTFSLGSSVAVGHTVYLRWVDDNAVATSPDQIIGLNNVNVLAAVPEPESYAMFLAGLGLLGAIARRRAAL